MIILTEFRSNLKIYMYIYRSYIYCECIFYMQICISINVEYLHLWIYPGTFSNFIRIITKHDCHDDGIGLWSHFENEYKSLYPQSMEIRMYANMLDNIPATSTFKYTLRSHSKYHVTSIFSNFQTSRMRLADVKFSVARCPRIISRLVIQCRHSSEQNIPPLAMQMG